MADPACAAILARLATLQAGMLECPASGLQSPSRHLHPETNGMSATSAATAATAAVSRHTTILRTGAWICLCLLLFTPYIISSNTTFPYVVGKALYSRLLIEALLVFWALLWLTDARYRPPRSAVLLLLAAGLAIAAFATVFGVSPQRSLWSSYERMQGLIDQAHWFAFALVLTSLLRTPREWRNLFNLTLVVSVGMSLLVISQTQGLENSVFGPLVRFDERFASTLGNPLFLGAYSMFHILLAAGLLARSLTGGGPRGAWLEWCWWGGAAALNLWTFNLTGSRGAFLALLAALGMIALLVLLMPSSSRRVRRAVTAALIFGTVSVTGASAAVIFAGAEIGKWAEKNSYPLIFRLSSSASWNNYTIKTRLATWNAGWEGFLDRPVLGWGPENFVVPFGRYVEGEIGGEMEIHDNAHNRPLEELVTRGPLAFLTFLGVWLLAFVTALRAALRAEPGDRILYLFAAGMVSAYFVQQLVLILSVSGNLMTTLLIAFTAHLETLQGEKGEVKKAPVAHGARAGVAALAVVLGCAGGIANYAAWRGASAVLDAIKGASAGNISPTRLRGTMEHAITSFTPLANFPRVLLFGYVAKAWPKLRESSEIEATKLLSLAEREAETALASESENWRLRASVSEMYRALADADPAFKEKADSHTVHAREMAPNRNPDQVAPSPRSKPRD